MRRLLGITLLSVGVAGRAADASATVCDRLAIPWEEFTGAKSVEFEFPYTTVEAAQEVIGSLRAKGIPVDVRMSGVDAVEPLAYVEVALPLSADQVKILDQVLFGGRDVKVRGQAPLAAAIPGLSIRTPQRRAAEDKFVDIFYNPFAFEWFALKHLGVRLDRIVKMDAPLANVTRDLFHWTILNEKLDAFARGLVGERPGRPDLKATFDAAFPPERLAEAGNLRPAIVRLDAGADAAVPRAAEKVALIDAVLEAFYNPETLQRAMDQAGISKDAVPGWGKTPFQETVFRLVMHVDGKPAETQRLLQAMRAIRPGNAQLAKAADAAYPELVTAPGAAPPRPALGGARLSERIRTEGDPFLEDMKPYNEIVAYLDAKRWSLDTLLTTALGGPRAAAIRERVHITADEKLSLFKLLRDALQNGRMDDVADVVAYTETHPF